MLCEKFKLNTRNKLLTTLSHFRSLKREGLTIVSAVKYPMNEGKLHGDMSLRHYQTIVKDDPYD